MLACFGWRRAGARSPEKRGKAGALGLLPCSPSIKQHEEEKPETRACTGPSHRTNTPIRNPTRLPRAHHPPLLPTTPTSLRFQTAVSKSQGKEREKRGHRRAEEPWLPPPPPRASSCPTSCSPVRWRRAPTRARGRAPFLSRRGERGWRARATERQLSPLSLVKPKEGGGLKRAGAATLAKQPQPRGHKGSPVLDPEEAAALRARPPKG